jgi:thioredoxin-related protein
MSFRIFSIVLLLLVLPPQAWAYEFLVGYDTAPTVAKALERVNAQPDKHVLIYFGMSAFCPPCEQARAILNSDAVRDKWRPNYVVVNIDIFEPTPAEREVIEQVRVSWAPLLVFLDRNGKRVAYSRQLRSGTEALVLNEFVSQRKYAMSALGKVSGQDFDPKRLSRAAAESPRIDDRPRLSDVLAQKHDRLEAAELRQLLSGRRMRKESQEWFLTLDFKERNLLEATGSRKNGRGDARGLGKWYVTRKNKLCVELTLNGPGVDENWCRHVFRANDTYYLSKDLRPTRLVYRLVPDNT